MSSGKIKDWSRVDRALKTKSLKVRLAMQAKVPLRAEEEEAFVAWAVVAFQAIFPGLSLGKDHKTSSSSSFTGKKVL